MSKEIRFECVIECSSACCGGATILTIKEISKLYKFFPLTIGFRKIYPINSNHRSYIEDFTIKYKSFYITGDFIAGNRLKKRCRMLKDSLCSIHRELKPLQCKVIPFSVTFPEEIQHLVIVEKRKGAFRFCKGFHENASLVWNGEFVKKQIRENFYKLKDSLVFQKDIMEKIFFSFENNPFFEKFIQSKDGLFEVPIIQEFIDEICIKGSISNKADFLKTQKTLLLNELTVSGFRNSLFIDALNMMEKTLK